MLPTPTRECVQAEKQDRKHSDKGVGRGEEYNMTKNRYAK